MGSAGVPLECGIFWKDVKVNKALDNTKALVPSPGCLEYAPPAHTWQRGSDGLLFTCANDGGKQVGEFQLWAGVVSQLALHCTVLFGNGRLEWVDIGPQVRKAPVALSFPPVEENFQFVVVNYHICFSLLLLLSNWIWSIYIYIVWWITIPLSLETNTR